MVKIKILQLKKRLGPVSFSLVSASHPSPRSWTLPRVARYPVPLLSPVSYPLVPALCPMYRVCLLLGRQHPHGAARTTVACLLFSVLYPPFLCPWLCTLRHGRDVTSRCPSPLPALFPAPGSPIGFLLFFFLFVFVPHRAASNPLARARRTILCLMHRLLLLLSLCPCPRPLPSLVPLPFFFVPLKPDRVVRSRGRSGMGSNIAWHRRHNDSVD